MSVVSSFTPWIYSTIELVESTSSSAPNPGRSVDSPSFSNRCPLQSCVLQCTQTAQTERCIQIIESCADNDDDDDGLTNNILDRFSVYIEKVHALTYCWASSVQLANCNQQITRCHFYIYFYIYIYSWAMPHIAMQFRNTQWTHRSNDANSLGR